MAAAPPEITKPVRIDEDTLIHNVYKGSDGSPDDQSQANFSQYLVDRMYGAEDPIAKQYRPGAEVPRRRLMFNGWLLRPRLALGLTIVSTILANVIVNSKSIRGVAAEIPGDISNRIDPATITVPGKSIPQKPTTNVMSYPIRTSGIEQRSGIAENDTLSAKGLISKIRAIKGGRIEKIVITGNASDEWTADGNKSVGRPDANNQKLALKRVELFSQNVERIATEKGVKLPQIETRAEEHILGYRQLGELLADVQQSQYSSVLAAISAYNNGDKQMSAKLRSEIQTLIGSKRIDTADVMIKQTVSASRTITIPAHIETLPHHDKHYPFTPLVIPIPPIPRLRRAYRDPFVRPPIINEEPIDKVWIELYEEALKKNGELVEDAWSLTRKYQALYREERITQGLRYDYRDDNGEAQSINVLFVDRPELDEPTIDAVTDLMFDISLMRKGKVAEGLDTVVVLPSEHTGPQRPDKMGLGIDEQYHRNVLGVAIPVIGLVEIQLPKKPTQRDIDRFNGLRWVLAHEVAGHFTDVNARARFIDKAKSNRKGRTFTARNPWTQAGDDGYAGVAHRGTLEAQQFSITHPHGEQGEYIVYPGDPQLAATKKARLRGQAPTNYGDTSPSELHAETAAAVVTSIPIPAREAGLPRVVLGSKAGYFVDSGLQHRFVSHVGALENQEELEWSPERVKARQGTFNLTILVGDLKINQDKDEHRVSETAKKRPYQEDQKRLKILARARR